jgi:hypothetical protein
MLLSNRMWRCTPVIPALERLRKEDCEFEINLSYSKTQLSGPPFCSAGRDEELTACFFFK